MFALTMLYYSSLFIFGAMVGSFLNVCIYRLPKECMTLNYPKRSHCQSCQTQLVYFPDNIPILSWFLFWGKCRYCKAPFSFRYPAIELLTACLFVLHGWTLAPNLPEEYVYFTPPFVGNALYLLYALVFCSCLIVVSFIDLSPLRIIPDEITLGGTLLWPIAAYFCPGMFSDQILSSLADSPAFARFLTSLYGAFFGFSLLFSVSFFGKFFFTGSSLSPQEAMGFGDVKLMAFLGAFLGWKQTLLTLFVSSFLGALFGSANWLLTRKNTIPFGPYLSFGALIVLLGSSFFEAWLSPYFFFL